MLRQVAIVRTVDQLLDATKSTNRTLRKLGNQLFGLRHQLLVWIDAIHDPPVKTFATQERSIEQKDLLASGRPHSSGQKPGCTNIGGKTDRRIAATQLHRLAGQHQVCAERETDPPATDRSV